ncbi:unnamed protein product [Sphagnum balticum]
MGKGPGLYYEIGKKTRDLLTRDFECDRKFTITTTTENGIVFTTTGVKGCNGMMCDVNTLFKNKYLSANMKVDTNANIFTTIRGDDCALGATSILSFTFPDFSSGKLEFQHSQEYAGITLALGMTPSPIVEITGVLGTEGLVIGGELAIDHTRGISLNKYNAGIGFARPDFNASIILAEKGNVLKASYLHTLSPASKTTLAAEIKHMFSRNENTFTMGGLYELDKMTSMKGRLNNHGQMGVTLQHEFRPKNLVTFSGEVDTKALDHSAKFGIAIALNS